MSSHCPRPRGRSTAAAVAVVGLTLGFAPSASAATAVFGGETNAHEAIVVRADAKAKQLRSIAIAWEAPCGDGTRFTDAVELTPAAASTTPQPQYLLVTRNGKGRFAGQQLTTYSSTVTGDAAGVVADIKGRLKGRRATGTLAATVTMLDAATGAVKDTCKTGTLQWSARRDAGHIYGGTTAQDEPVVVRLDRRRKNVTQMLLGWHSASCEPPDNFLRTGEQLGHFRLRGARFGDAWGGTFGLDGGGQGSVSYTLDGTVARRSAHGSFQVNVKETDAAGAVTMTCDTSSLSWRATTGWRLRHHSAIATYHLNEAGVLACRERIEARQYTLESDWGDSQPKASVQNAYLESHSWDEYAAWHLGLTEGAKDGTKARYAFVYGDFRRVHRSGLIAIVYRAAEWRHKEVELAAFDLLQLLDKVSG
jgi:hypothetical protein